MDATLCFLPAAKQALVYDYLIIKGGGGEGGGEGIVINFKSLPQIGHIEQHFINKSYTS